MAGKIGKVVIRRLMLLALALGIVLQFNSCISIKSDYPEINFYNLDQTATTAAAQQDLEIALMIRDFSIAAEYDSERILTKWEGLRIQRYFYHRWTADPAELITDYFTGTMSRSSVFSSVITPPTVIIPDYILEGEIIEMMAYSSEDEETENYVVLSLKMSLISTDPAKTEENVVMDKVYTTKVQRENEKAATIAPAFSNAASKLSREVLSDIIASVNQQGK